jgi:hypothetical protein
MLYLEIQRGKTEMPEWSARHCELGATASCTVRATVEMANCGQKESEHRTKIVLSVIHGFCDNHHRQLHDRCIERISACLSPE